MYILYPSQCLNLSFSYHTTFITLYTYTLPHLQTTTNPCTPHNRFHTKTATFNAITMAVSPHHNNYNDVPPFVNIAAPHTKWKCCECDVWIEASRVINAAPITIGAGK